MDGRKARRGSTTKWTIGTLDPSPAWTQKEFARLRGTLTPTCRSRRSTIDGAFTDHIARHFRPPGALRSLRLGELSGSGFEGNRAGVGRGAGRAEAAAT